MNKTEALKIILEAAEYYHKNLENQRLLFIYEKDKKHIKILCKNYFRTTKFS